MTLRFEEFEELKSVGRTIDKIEKAAANLNGIIIDVRVVTLEGGKQGMVNLERWDEFKKGCVKNDQGGVDIGEGWKIAAPRKGLTVGFLYPDTLGGATTGNSLTIG